MNGETVSNRSNSFARRPPNSASSSHQLVPKEVYGESRVTGQVGPAVTSAAHFTKGSIKAQRQSSSKEVGEDSEQENHGNHSRDKTESHTAKEPSAEPSKYARRNDCTLAIQKHNVDGSHEKDHRNNRYRETKSGDRVANV